MIKQNAGKKSSPVRRLSQTVFSLLLAVAFFSGFAPTTGVNALYPLAGDVTYAYSGSAERVDADRIILAGAAEGESDVALEAGKRVVIRRNGDVQYATSRTNERLSAVLYRAGVDVGPLEMVRAQLSDDEVLLDVAADFTYYETVSEPLAYSTVYATDHTLPKGETKVTQAGADGVRNVTYEIIYADGSLVSRQAVTFADCNVVNEVVSTGTLVKEAQPGDTIASVIQNDDGSGYLLMKSGDSLHFTGSMEVKCTAYNSAEPLVGTITATGTKVHVGVVAVDRNVIPLGTLMFITTKDGSYTYGMGHAEDTGVRGKVVDLYMNTLRECNQFGRRSSIVYFLDK